MTQATILGLKGLKYNHSIISIKQIFFPFLQFQIFRNKMHNTGKRG